MDNKEISTIILATLVLALAVSFKDHQIFLASSLSFFIIILVNVLAKKIIGFHFETKVKTKFWTLQQYGLRKDMKFKTAIPLLWIPLIISLFTKGFVYWLGILEFEMLAKAERVAKRHGIYRFTQVTEWHMGLIAMWGMIANLIFAVGGYLIGFELFAKLSIYYIAWSIIPLGRLDGSKIYYASRALWIVIATITILILGWGFVI